MYSNSTLKTYIETSPTINTKSLILAEWNLNTSENILAIGNYRYRPQDTSNTQGYTFSSESVYTPQTTWQQETSSTTTPYYYGATDADVTVDGGYDDEDNVLTYVSQNLRNKLLFSLEDCFGKFRPRSGINKLVFFNNRYIPEISNNVTDRPRYYVANKDDKFKYWTSFRTENSVERGISKTDGGGTPKYYIDDASPFVVYNNQVPANRIVLKIQTNVGTTELENLKDTSNKFITDPFYGMTSNGTVPLIWKIQYLDSNNVWKLLKSFSDTTPIFSEDGYLELAYGMTNISSSVTAASVTASTIYYAGEYNSSSLLPVESIIGYTYLVKDLDGGTAGKYYIYNGVVDNGSGHNDVSGYYSFIPTYGWYVKSETVSNLTDYLTELVNPPSYGTGASLTYRGLQYIKGLRVVVDTMNVNDSTFDLIELSPRLAVDLTDRTVGFDIKKNASDLGSSGMPVGQLLSSTGNLSLFDYDQAFNKHNTASILNIKNSSNQITYSFASKNLQVKLYDVITDNSNNLYVVPLKTLYLEGFPETNNVNRELSLSLKDLYLYFESLTAPEMLIQNQPVSFVIATLLDNIGFSNYSFKRLTTETEELTVPYFFVGPNVSVAQVLSDLATSAQMATFFDEYNNLIFMSREYLMPSKNVDGTYGRTTDLTLYGSTDAQRRAVYENETIDSLANIIDLRSEVDDIFTDGRITFTTRSIQRQASTLSQQGQLASDRTYGYKPVILWEVSPTDSLTSINTDVTKQSAYSLSAMTLNQDLSSSPPYVDSSGVLQNNTIDFGESIYWISRYNGYFQANGEIIRYDAIEYSVAMKDATATVWVSSTQEYQNYFSKLLFGGKMYPTGRIRIYSEPYYDKANNKLKEGVVAKHGRAQFGTTATAHTSGISNDWLDNAYAKTIKMSSTYLFNGGSDALSFTQNSAAGNLPAATSSKYFPYRTSFIKNILSSTYKSENEIRNQKSIEAGTVKASALVIDGNSATDGSSDYISYVYKDPNKGKSASESIKYSHFGTRLRIIGTTSADPELKLQTPSGSSAYYNKINGAGGGLAIMLNPTTNNGYYFEIGALTDTSINQYTTGSKNLNNVFFYKLTKQNGAAETDPAVPSVLFQGSTNILVDNGSFVGQNRFINDKTPTVYDLAVEYELVGKTLKFHLYLNNKYLATVEDKSPLKQYKNMALFVRGSSKLMFEHVYALNENYSKTNGSSSAPVTYLSKSGPSNDQLRVQSIASAIQKTYLNGISSSSSPDHVMFYDEFGTIMREAAYFNVKYDKAYPALYARLAPTTNNLQGYAVSGFNADAYGAEFLVFNVTDTILNLDNTTGNYLQIYGITFTQQSDTILTVDDYFSQKGDLSNPQFDNGSYVNVANNKIYNAIKSSRLNYGRKEFAINAPYLQNLDNAYRLMGWMVSKIGKPKRSVAVQIFHNPMIQLGDIVSIDYTNKDNVLIFSADPGNENYATFVVYCIEQSRSSEDVSMVLYLSEVV